MSKKHKKKNNGNIYEERTKEAKTVRKAVLYILLAIVILIIIAAVSGYFYVQSAFKPVDADNEETVEFEIPMGSSSSEIATILEEKDLIKNSLIFRAYIKLNNKSDFQAGEYELSPSLSMKEIINRLSEGKLMEEPEAKLTIPEGKSVEEIADIVEDELSISSEDFLEVAEDNTYLKDLIEEYPDLLSDDILDNDVIMPLEGYLFAGTFEFYEKDPSPEEVITKMIDATKELVDKNKDALDDSGLNTHEMLTLASIVERESKYEEDRPKVAQVFLNRLKEDMKLQSDITAAYANGEHKITMTYEDVEVDSPYNTYNVKGLPPAPIASPSIEAIEAVLHPAGKDFDYEYFYARPDGETHYSKTLDEHKEVIDKYRHEWDELEKKSKKE